MQNRVPTPIAPDLGFVPVPRKYRYDGWTPERQRGFIAALAETGSVKAAARRINMSPEGAYYLRRQPGADGFRAAWAAALAHGVQRLTDLAIDRAIEGVPVPIYWRGEQVGERRVFNERLLMFVLKHHLPDQYDARPLPRGTRHPDTVAREDAEAAAAAATTGPETTEAALAALADWLDEAFNRYRHKVAAERRHRRAGRIVAADFTLRQLLEIELLLALGGAGEPLLKLWREAHASGLYPGTAPLPESEPHAADDEAPGADPTEPPSDEDPADDAPPDPLTTAAFITAELARLRTAVWAETADPARPTNPLTRDQAMRGGPTHTEREKTRNVAERRLAKAQAEWEAAATEEGWARWKGDCSA